MSSRHYVIWKDKTNTLPDAPWCFEGDEWGDTGSCATFEDAIAATVGRNPDKVRVEVVTDDE